ncbi:hypothetical protein ACFLZV_02985 [Candidatus Margulisiibacteriota bacterium]
MSLWDKNTNYCMLWLNYENSTHGLAVVGSTSSDAIFDFQLDSQEGYQFEERDSFKSIFSAIIDTHRNEDGPIVNVGILCFS